MATKKPDKPIGKKVAAPTKSKAPVGGAAVRAEIAELRAFWAARQALGGPPGTQSPLEAQSKKAGVVDLVRATGWLTTAGGQGPHLAMRARHPNYRRDDLDNAVIKTGELVHVPAARGCVMLVPAEEAHYALALARKAYAARLENAKNKLDLSEKEIAKLGDSIAAALAKHGTLGPDALRNAGQVRSLGEAGKKIGESTTLPLAIRRMELLGVVRRVHQKIDSNRFDYALFAEGAPARKVEKLPAAEAHREVAKRLFRWQGPIARSVLAWWAGITQAEAKAAMASLALVRVDIDGSTEELWALEEDVDILKSTRAGEGRHALLPMRDNHVSLRHDLALLVDEAHRAHVGIEPKKGITPGYAMGWMEHHTITRDGQLVGLWEWDPEAKEVVVFPFEKPPAQAKKALAAEVDKLTRFIRDDCGGDARITAIDHLPAQRERAVELRALRQ